MKPSNYILVTFFVFIVGCSLVLFISSLSHKNDNILTNKEYLFEDVSINVIVAEPEVLIRIHTAHKNSVSIHYPVNEIEPEKFYRINNDTLYVSRMALQNRDNRRVDIYTTNVRLVIAKNSSDIRITSFFSDKLGINAEQAKIEIFNTSIDEIVIQANHSNISMYSNNKSASIFAKLENESTFRAESKDIGKINVEKDESSRYSVY